MFSRIFIARPRLAAVISLFLCLSGLISLSKLPIAEYPEITPPTLYVSATYSGASADVVTKTVATPLENEINGVDNLLYFTSTSTNDGAYSCSVTFESGTDSDMALVNLQNAVNRAEAQLPEEVTQTGVTVQKRGDDMLAAITFNTDGTEQTLYELSNYVNNNIKDALSRIKGVSSATMLSTQEYSMRIWFDPLRLAGMGLSAEDIISAVQQQNREAAAGAIGSEGSSQYVQYKLNLTGRLITADEFGSIIVRTAGDRLVHLRDIATVELGSSSYGGRTWYNNKEAVGIALYRAPEANALDTIELVKAELSDWERSLPKGVSYDIAYDPTKFIKVSMTEMVTTLFSALALVIFITWIFLQEWRATLIPAIAIPVALLGTFSFMLLADYSLNTLTMFGLILVIGSLVDDAIVVVENTQSLMEREHLSAKDAATKGMSQITSAVIATTLVTLACYVPLTFYGGMVGAIYIQFAVTMCIALCLSTLVALTLSPALCALLLRPKEKLHGHSPFKHFNLLLDKVRDSYVSTAGNLIRRGLLTMILFAAAVGGVYYLYDRTPSSFLPDEDKGVIFCDVELQNEAAQSRTEAALLEINNLISPLPGIKAMIMVSGMSLLSGSGENVGMVIATLNDWDQRTTDDLYVDSIINQIRAKVATVAAAKVTVMKPPAIMGLGVSGGASFDLCGVGEVEAKELGEQTRALLAALNGSEDVLYATSPYQANIVQLRFELDREKGQMLNISSQEVASALQYAIASYYINDFTYEGSNFKVKLQSFSDYRSSIEVLNSLPVRSTTGTLVPLSSLGSIVYETGPSQIVRFNKQTAASFSAQTMPGVTSARMFELVDGYEFPTKYHVEWTGLSYQEKQNEGQLVYLMALALIFAYLFLVAQYESWSIPLPVMLTVLFAMGGALLGINLTGLDLSIYAQLGMVMLIGLSAKSAILMVEFSKQEHESGLSITDAAMSGARLRFRAVMMTAWSFICGVLPLVFATGAGASSRQAIGITTCCGMLVASCIGIFFTPALYALIERIREAVKTKLGLMPASPATAPAQAAAGTAAAATAAAADTPTVAPEQTSAAAQSTAAAASGTKPAAPEDPAPKDQ